MRPARTSIDPRPHPPPRSVARPFVLLLLVGFGALFVLGVGLVLQHRARLESGEAISRNLEQTIALNQSLRRGMDRQINLLQRYTEKPDPVLQDQFMELNFSLGDKQIRYLTLEIGQEERLAVEAIKRLQSEISLAAVRAFELLKAGDPDGSRRALREIEQARAQIDARFESLNGLQAAELRTALAGDRSRATAGAVLAVFAIVLVVLTAFMLLLRRRVLRPLDRLLDATGRVRRGQFGTRAPVLSDDELGHLARSFNDMAESLGESYGTLEQKVDERTRELRRVQRQLIQSEKMSAVGQLVSGVAHELNNPLTAIMGFAELAESSLAASRPDAPELEKLRIILRQSDRCRKIVASLLEFARQQDTVLRPVRVNDVVTESLRLRDYELGTHGMNLHCDLDPGDPVVMADALKLQQVVLVLINNAVDAIREVSDSGRISVRVSSDDRYARLSVRDDGPGITEIDRIFDPFYTTKPVGKGTGLGLSVCYGIVREHGGEIRVANMNPGAEFTVRLPIAPETAVVQGERTASPAPVVDSPETALVVDDEQALVDLQLSMLKRLGLRAEGTRDGEQAIEYLKRNAVGLVISDIRMPGPVNGLKLYAWVRDNRPELAGRFLLITGDPDLDDPTGDAPPVPCIGKPFSFEEYAAAVRKALGQPCAAD